MPAGWLGPYSEALIYTPLMYKRMFRGLLGVQALKSKSLQCLSYKTKTSVTLERFPSYIDLETFKKGSISADAYLRHLSPFLDLPSSAKLTVVTPKVKLL